MLYETLNQPIICIILIMVGFLSGFIYDLSNYIIFLCNNNKVIKHFFDFLATILAFLIFYFTILKIDFGNVRFYHVIIFLIFLILQRITLGKLIAKTIQICYNYIVKLFKLLRRITIDRRKKHTTD